MLPKESGIRNQESSVKCLGFSLVELMLALGLIAVVTAVAIPNLRDYNSSEDLGIAVERFMLALRNTQSSANSGVQCPTGELATSWQVNLNLASTPDTYSVVANCKTSSGTIAARTVSTSNFASTAESSRVFSAVADACGANINASIFFTGNQFTYQCSGGSVLSTPALKIIISSSEASRSAVIQPGGVLRLE